MESDGPQHDASRAIPSLLVSGTASVQVTPDLASIRLALSVQAATAEDSRNEAAAIMRPFLEKVKELVGQNGSVKTQHINFQPIYKPRNRNPDEDPTPKVVAYRAQNLLTVSLSDLNLVGPIIDLALANGLNGVSGLDFQVKDDSGPRTEALAVAIERAHKKALGMAKAAGTQLSGVWEIVESSHEHPFAMAMKGRSLTYGGEPTSIEPGEMSITCSVSVRYFLRPQ